MNVIELRNLARYFGLTPAVVDLSLDVPEGSVFGLLGENGCGKTTTINIIMGALVPNQGTARVFDGDPLLMPPETRARIGYVADEMELPGWMRLSEAMKVHASYFAAWDRELAARLLKEFELTPEQTFGGLSRGQKRRFIITLIMSQRPDLLVLDEPSGGLDAAVRRQFLDLLLELTNERGVTILIASHILSDVERVVDHVAFVKGGRVLRQAQLEDLKANVKRLCLNSREDAVTIEQRFEVLAKGRQQDAELVTVADFDPAKLDGIECHVENLNLEELFLVYNGNGGDAR